MTDTTIDTDFVRRFCADSAFVGCTRCGLDWEECDEIKVKLKELPCSIVRRLFAEMTDEQRAWVAQAVEEKIKAEKGRK